MPYDALGGERWGGCAMRGGPLNRAATVPLGQLPENARGGSVDSRVVTSW